MPIGSIQSTSAMVQIRAQVISSVLLDKSGSPVDTSGSDIRFNTVSRLSAVVSDGADGTGLLQRGEIYLAQAAAGQSVHILRETFRI